MDYHVLVVGRIREAYLGGATMDEALARDPAHGRVATSAAIVTVGVLSIFGVLSMLMFKQFGVGP